MDKGEGYNDAMSDYFEEEILKIMVERDKQWVNAIKEKTNLKTAIEIMEVVVKWAAILY